MCSSDLVSCRDQPEPRSFEPASAPGTRRRQTRFFIGRDALWTQISRKVGESHSYRGAHPFARPDCIRDLEGYFETTSLSEATFLLEGNGGIEDRIEILF